MRDKNVQDNGIKEIEIDFGKRPPLSGGRFQYNMEKKYLIFFAGLLLFLNIFAWKDVFILAGSRNLMVDFLDVGQGDAVFIETPQNHQVLIDGGPDSLALAELSSLMPSSDRTIDLVILTHPEKDHMQGLIDILQRYKADYILWTGVKRDTPGYQAWTDILAKQQGIGSKIIVVKAGDRILLGDVLINILFPAENMAGKETKNTSNDTSIVSRLAFANISFLFTADIASKTEKELVNSYELAGIVSNVLKVAHHGSKYSTSDLFLENVKPEIAVISAGEKNTYGHPTPEVLQRLEKFGIKVFRTDKDGDVKIESDGKNILVK